MESLSPEQIEYKRRTLHQLQVNQAALEASLSRETDPKTVKTIQKQLGEIDAHMSRLQDELAGNVVMDEPVADELFRKAAQALARGKFYLARRQIAKLETIEPFYPGIARLKQEAESQQVSRRTRSIAEGKASGYSSVLAVPDSVIAPPGAGAAALPASTGPADFPAAYSDEPDEPWYRSFFQFHVILSCLVVLLLLCVVFGMAGFSILQWLVEGGG
ncbi:MAG: hypothetical protein Kow0031_13480 [Anaerolineae bacterium]